MRETTQDLAEHLLAGTRLCQTGDVHFDAFWTLVGTTAPVIALANVVVLASTIRMLPVFRSKPDFTASQRSEARFGKTFQYIAFTLTCLNLGLQAFVLYEALESLNTGHNTGTSSRAIWEEVGGFYTIVLVTFASAIAQTSAARLAKSERGLHSVATDTPGRPTSVHETPNDN